MDKRKAFNFYRSYYEVALELPQAAQREYLMALLHFQFTGEEPKLKGMAKFALMSQKHSIIRQLEGYSHGKKGGAPPKGTDNPPPKGSNNHTPEGNENQVQGEVQEQVQEQVQEKGKGKRFTPPTIEEVEKYCLERKNSVDATKWFNHYTSNGWKVGKNPMANWKAAVRTWEKNEFSDGRKQQQEVKFLN